MKTVSRGIAGRLSNPSNKSGLLLLIVCALGATTDLLADDETTSDPNYFQVVDHITGFKGRVVGRVDYISGCRQYLVLPECGEDGKYPESHWFDEERVRLQPQVVQAESPLTVLGGQHVLEEVQGFGPEAPKK